MTIKVGEKVPSVDLAVMGESGPEGISTDDLFAGKKVIIFGVPGAFTPTCSAKHLPGYVQHADDLKAKGVDAIVCVSVNDPFVMGAWGKDQGVGDKVVMLADGSAKLATALGLELDLTERGLGMRNQRFSMLVDDGVVKSIEIDAAGTFEKTSAETMLSVLG